MAISDPRQGVRPPEMHDSSGFRPNGADSAAGLLDIRLVSCARSRRAAGEDAPDGRMRDRLRL